MEPPANYINRGLGRYEVFDYAQDRLSELQRYLNSKGLPFSFHAPLFRPAGFPYSPVAVFFLSDNPHKRQLSFDIIQSALTYAKEWGAEYVVTHLTGAEDSPDERQTPLLAEQAAARLSALASQYGVPIYLETGGYTGFFHEAAQFVALASSDPGLGICIDIGHTFLIALARGRPFLKDIATLAPQAKSIHLWNTRGLEHYKQHHHIPVHPSQRPEAGWIDIKRALGIILGHNPRCHIIFEYYYNKKDAPWVKEGFTWVKGIAERFHS